MPLLPAMAQERTRAFDVPAQPASSGIRMLAEQADIQIIVAGSAVQGRTTNAVRGRLDTRAALDRLLLGSGLFVRSLAGGVAILDADAAHEAVEARQPIVVTGRRIAQPEPASITPSRTTSMEEAERLGRVTVYDALMREPAISAGIGLSSAFGQNWDAGVASVSLRNLGTNRSLTLIDGRRRVSGSARSSAVDINMIPAAMVERVEIVTGGAAPIYGADAVTGAINIITKRHVDGVVGSATSGISQRGDADIQSISLAAGSGFAGGRGSLAIGGTYSKIAPLVFTQRYRTYVNSMANPDNGGANDGIPDRVTVPDFRQIYYAYEPSFYFNGNSYLVENGAPRIAGYDKTLFPGEFSYGDGGDGRNLRDQDQLRGGLEAFALIARADYAFSDAIEYGANLDYGRTRYDGIAGIPLHRDDSRPNWFDGAGGSVAYLDNPFLPPAVRQFMRDNGLAKLDIERTYGNFPIMRELHDRKSFTLGQSLGGTLAGGLKWTAFHQYGRATDDVRTTNIPYTSHWVAARDVIADPVTGQPVCRDPAARAAGCVPLDIFSQEPASEALKAYVLGTRREKRTNTQSVFGADITGKVFSLPHGDAVLTLGIEHRRETLRTRDDPLARTELTFGIAGYAVHPDLDVSSQVSEAYGKLVLPLLEDIPFARHLEIEGAYRYSDYSTTGGTHSWEVGGTWSPADGIRFRATRSRTVRTPNFGELYEGVIVSEVGSINDPCEAGDYYQNAARSANCRALGIVTPLGDFKMGPFITTEGNPDLKPETSDSLTLGMVLQPRLLPGFKATADYWDIDIKDAIIQYSDTTMMNLCVDLPTIDNIFCRSIDRDPADGHVTAIRTRQINASRMRARGLDFSAAYGARLGSGNLRFSFNGTYLLEQRTETTPGVPAGNIKYEGDWQHPRFRGTLLTSYEIGDFNVNLDTRFISAGRLDVNAKSPEAYDDNHIPPVVYNDLSIYLSVNKEFGISFGVNNILDTLPPYAYTVYKNGTIYDNIGRFFYTKIKMNL
ncbi:TonB-dependent receptor [Sphingomonas sp. dw_22]|uniref:TonB-dependent receptor n=1 Tax=Sphingomonas sp. dw_22 TaxID=2721175 RepID=UPI001BD671F4|nr:TonB-dependent receptor [Sphingomonas sp. dw_22]